MTIRQDILTNIKTTLDVIPDFNSVNITQVIMFDLETEPMPACFIVSGAEAESANAVVTMEAYTWDIDIAFFARDIDMETLHGKVHVEMMKDEKRGLPPNVVETRRIGSSPDVLEADRSLQAMTMTYRITYRVPRGTV